MRPRPGSVLDMRDEQAPPLMQRRRASRRGIGVAVLAAVLFGVSAPFAKLLLREMAPQLLAGLLYVGAGVGLAALWLVQRASGSHEAPLTRRDAPWLAGAITCGGVLAPLLLMTGLERTPASSASLLLNLEGVFTAVVAWFIVRENFDRRIALGMAAIVGGGVVLSYQGWGSWEGPAGPLAIAGACFCWGVDNNLTQRVSAGDPVQVATLKGLVAGSVNVALAGWLGANWPAAPDVGAALLLGFLSYGVSLVLFVLALRHLGTARTAAYFSSAPFVGAAVSLVVFRETPTALFLAAGAMMILGVALHLSERHEHEHAHEPIEHEHAHVHDEHHRHEHGRDDPPGKLHRHCHRHESLVHTHPHYPDIHHRHKHQ